MLLCGVLKYGSVFVTDKRRDRLQKLSFGTCIANQSQSCQSSSCNTGNSDSKTVPSSSSGPSYDLVLTDEESMYLVLKGYLIVSGIDGKALSLTDLWEVFIKKNTQFPYKYKTFEFFRSRSYVVRPGLHYGSDYTVYKTAPHLCHSELCVTVVGSADSNNCREQNWRHISTLTRVMPDVMKLAVLCYVLPHSWSVQDATTSINQHIKITETDNCETFVGNDHNTVYENVLSNVNDNYISNYSSFDGLPHPEQHPVVLQTCSIDHDEELQLFLQESMSLQGGSARCSPETIPAEANNHQIAAVPEVVSTMQRNNSLYGIESEDQPSQSESSTPISPYLDQLFPLSNAYPQVDLTSFHCLDELTVRPVSILVRRLNADATKYQSVGQIHDKFTAKSIKKTPKRFLDGTAPSKSSRSNKRKRKRRDIAEIRVKSMSKTNQLWKNLEISEPSNEVDETVKSEKEIV